jgi:8-oxo-dGTP pyrophosphatase MutT (NUDIX family)
MEMITYAGCFLVLPTDVFVFQKRDNIPIISQPGGIGTFGGEVEPFEDIAEGLNRELLEEIGIERGLLKPTFIGYYLDFCEIKNRFIKCHFYFSPIEEEPITCNEGNIITLKSTEILSHPDVIPLQKDLFLRITLMKRTGLI